MIESALMARLSRVVALTGDQTSVLATKSIETVHPNISELK
jgi:hypothetical protein